MVFVVMRFRFPDHARPYKVRGGIIVGIIAIIVSLFFIVLYLPIGSSSLTGTEWIIVAVWVIAGLIIYLIQLPKKNRNKELREKSLYNQD